MEKNAKQAPNDVASLRNNLRKSPYENAESLVDMHRDNGAYIDTNGKKTGGTSSVMELEDDDFCDEDSDQFDNKKIVGMIKEISHNIKRTGNNHDLLHTQKFLDELGNSTKTLILETSGIYVASREFYDSSHGDLGSSLPQRRKMVLSLLNQAKNDLRRLGDESFVKNLVVSIDSWLAAERAPLDLFIPEVDPSQFYR